MVRECIQRPFWKKIGHFENAEAHENVLNEISTHQNHRNASKRFISSLRLKVEFDDIFWCKLKKLLQKRNPYIVIKFVDISRLMMQVFLVKAPSFIMRVQVGQKLRQNLNWPSLKFFPIIFILQRKKCTDRYAKKSKKFLGTIDSSQISIS